MGGAEPKWITERREKLLRAAAKIVREQALAMPARELARLLEGELDRTVPPEQVSSILSKYAVDFGIVRYRRRGKILYGLPKHELPRELASQLEYVKS